MWKHILMMIMNVWKTRELIEMMTRWIILARLIVVIFSVKKILLTSLIWWIDWLIDFEIKLKIIAIYLMIKKMKIAVWLIKKIVVLLIKMMMIAV